MRSGNRKHDWEKLRLEWLSGKYKNLRAMARELGISEATILNRAAKDGWRDQRLQLEEKVAEKSEAEIIKIKVRRNVEIFEKQLKYAQVMLGLSLNTFKGKTKLSKDSDAISMLRLALETQLRALQALSNAENDKSETTNMTNVQVNINNDGNPIGDWSNDQIIVRMKEIQDEKKRLLEEDS
jgi:hypothetical protein